MKKFLFVLPLVLIITNISNADQLAWLTKDEVTQAMDYINNNNIKEVILFCDCCDLGIKEKVLISKIYYRQVKNSKDYYEIVIEGTTADTKKVNQVVDLAYVFIKKDDKAARLGLEIGLKCNPCCEPFNWF